ncbi:hypothetical protein F0562_027225 [Nyssa sinensis]|uniref:ZF-HD dimerization-type domain-containing protein n=1 Tax=Nyssa sinensis TaxID=561372 RepID=A0A5J5B772_9ASTE|nr:hypothetical protein F0562_027225 [Nyssa sinensis]
MRSLSSLGYNPIFRESTETLDHHHLQQSSLGQGRRPNSDQLFEPKSSGSSFKAPVAAPIRYRECLKNHAASIGGNIVDGCGEFMPSGRGGLLGSFEKRGASTSTTSNTAVSIVQATSQNLNGAATDSSSEDLNFNAFQSNVAPPQPPPFVLSKKRFRTKFTQEQKEKMLEFAEKVGWRIPKEDDADVQSFCAEVGSEETGF